MSQKAYLRVEQSPHVIPDKDRQIAYGLFHFTTPLSFEGDNKILIGRNPDLNLYSDFPSVSCIYLPSIYVSRNLAVIHTTKTVYQKCHVIEVVNEKKSLTSIGRDEPFKKRPLKNGDRFQITGVNFYKFQYVCMEDNELSGELGKDTLY